MELLFVALAGAIIGGSVRYLVPHRRSHGAALVPAIGTAAAVTVWSVLTWAGWPFDGTWIWVVTLLASAATSLAAALYLPRQRREADVRLLAELSKPSRA